MNINLNLTFSVHLYKTFFSYKRFAILLLSKAAVKGILYMYGYETYELASGNLRYYYYFQLQITLGYTGRNAIQTAVVSKIKAIFLLQGTRVFYGTQA